MTIDARQTIIAPVTPPGEGGVGIVRLSGPLSEATLCRYFHPSRPVSPFTSHRLYHGLLRDAEGETVDEVLAVVMRAPHSYTREDIVEIHCHGGPLIVQRILDLFLDGGGLRLARPGEFTLRAFLNGRLDLAQAEAVIDVIRSRSEAASAIAVRQMEGRLSRAIHGYRDELVDLLALVEAYIDFPEEDIELPVLERLAATAAGVDGRMETLLATFDSGRVLREGLSVLILGRPNVGKSSLLNVLLGEARAIVTDIPGTTRDTIEESLTLGGFPLRLVDTAGIRRASDPVEAEGVRRAQAKIASADLVLLVVDGSVETSEDDLLALKACADARCLLVVNKSDLTPVPLPESFSRIPHVFVSTHSGAGVDELQRRIVSFFAPEARGDARESLLLSDRRHREALLRARAGVGRFLRALADGASPEFLAVELREALHGLGEITGETTPDEVLDRIFSRFCIGK